MQLDVCWTKPKKVTIAVYNTLLGLYQVYSLFYCHHTLNQERGKTLMRSFNLDFASGKELKKESNLVVE